MNARAYVVSETLRISVGTKATVNVGDYSRGSRARGLSAVASCDNDMHPKEKLAPGGILELVRLATLDRMFECDPFCHFSVTL